MEWKLDNSTEDMIKPQTSEGLINQYELSKLGFKCTPEEGYYKDRIWICFDTNPRIIEFLKEKKRFCLKSTRLKKFLRLFNEFIKE